MRRSASMLVTAANDRAYTIFRRGGSRAARAARDCRQLCLLQCTETLSEKELLNLDPIWQEFGRSSVTRFSVRFALTKNRSFAKSAGGSVLRPCCIKIIAGGKNIVEQRQGRSDRRLAVNIDGGVRKGRGHASRTTTDRTAQTADRQ